MPLFALDLGNRQSKIKTKKIEKVFPSYYYKVRELGNRSLLGSIKGASTTEDYVTARDADEVYAWGEKLNAASAALVETIGGTDRYGKRKFRVLADMAIAKAAAHSKGADLNDVTIITGVPTTDFSNDETLDDLAKALKGMHSVTINNKPYSVNVKDAIVLPQSVGTIIDIVTDDYGNIEENELTQGRVGVVDVGGGTVLIDVLEALSLMDRGRDQLNSGATKLYEDIKRDVEKKFGAISVAQVEEAVRAGCDGRYIWSPNNRDTYDITEIVMRQRRAFTRDIVEKVTATYRNLSDMQAIVFTGGAANLLVPEEIYEELPSEMVIFAEDSELANVRGFYKYGLAQGLADE